MIIKQRKSTIARLVISGVAAFALILVSGCATTTYVANITDLQRAVLGKIRVTSTANTPILDLSKHPTTKGEAASRSAGNSLGECVRTVIFYPLCVAIVLPIFAAGEAAFQKSPDDLSVTRYSLGASESINGASALLEDKVRTYASNFTDLQISPATGWSDEDVKGGSTNEHELANNDLDVTLEVSLTRIESWAPPSANRLYFKLTGSARLVSTETGDEILNRRFFAWSSGHRPADWVMDGGYNFNQALDRGYDILAQKMVDKIFLEEYILKEQEQIGPFYSYNIVRFTGDGSAQVDHVYENLTRDTNARLEPKTWGPEMKLGCGLGTAPCKEFATLEVVQWMRPTFSWGRYPQNLVYLRKERYSMRDSQIKAIDEKLRGIESVRYDLRINSWPDGIIIETTGLIETIYRPEQNLDSCRSYSWTVRARYINNGMLRSSGWSRPKLFRTSCGISGQKIYDAVVKVEDLTDDSVEMVRIEGGVYRMGKPSVAKDDKYLRPHQVKVGSFLLDAHEVTQRQFLDTMHFNPSENLHSDHPVERVRWDQAKQFCERVGKRLPTEAEWEYAARSGSETKFSYGEDPEEGHGNYCALCSSSVTGPKVQYKPVKTSPVMQFKPSKWGLYDMHGNVAEWVADWYGPYPEKFSINPVGQIVTNLMVNRGGSLKVIRGGSFSSTSEKVASYSRASAEPFEKSKKVGFRCASDEKRKLRYSNLDASFEPAAIEQAAIEQAAIEQAVFGADITGTWVSNITDNNNKYFQKENHKKLVVTFEQNGERIVGNVSSLTDGYIEGIREGDTIKFSFYSTTISYSEISGEWNVSADGYGLEGSWKHPVNFSSGKWNLTKVR